LKFKTFGFGNLKTEDKKFIGTFWARGDKEYCKLSINLGAHTRLSKEGENEIWELTSAYMKEHSQHKPIIEYNYPCEGDDQTIIVLKEDWELILKQFMDIIEKYGSIWILFGRRSPEVLIKGLQRQDLQGRL
jgi:hypothetical protein